MNFIEAAFPLFFLLGFIIWMGCTAISYIYVRDELFKMPLRGWKESMAFYGCILTGPFTFIIMFLIDFIRTHFKSTGE
jgi:hypothetical protein